MFRSFSNAYSPQKLPSSHYSRSTLSPPENNNQTQATTLCDHLPKTPPSMRSKSPKYSLDNLMKEESNHVPRPGISSRNQILISTGGTDQGSEIIHRSLDSFYTEAESKKKAQQEDSIEKDLAVAKVHRVSSISGADPFEEQIDEFPEIMSISPFKDIEDEPDTRESPKGLKPRAFLMVQTKTLMYHTSTKASPFSRGLNSNEKSARLIDSLDDIKDHPEKENNMSLKMRRKVFMDVGIIKRVCDYLEYGDIASLNSVYLSYREYQTYRGVFIEELLSKFLEGPNKKQQYLFWSTVLHSRGHFYEDAIAWTEHSSNPCSVAETIAKDVDRTLPDCDAFQSEEGREPLLKVLMALCNTYPELGYVQGFNSLVGVSLLNLQEQEAYSLMIHLFEDLKVKQLFLNDFEGLSLLNYQLEVYLEHYLPEVFNLFENSMNISYYTYSWFITLFADNLRGPNVMKLWNFFFIKEFPFILQFSLATFSINKEKILKMDIDDVGHYIKSYLWDLDHNEKELFEIALTFEDVTPKLMRDLESFYKAGKTRVKLVEPKEENKDQTAHWEIISPNKKPHSSPEQNSKSRESEKWSGKKLAPFFKNVFTAVTVDFPDTVKNLFKKSTPRPEIKEDEKPKEEEKKEESTPMKEIDLNIENTPRTSQKNKRRSIATRMRKSMGRTIHSKRGRESTKKYHKRDSKTPKNHTEQSPSLNEGDLLKINWDEIPGYTSDNDPKTRKNADEDDDDNKENNDVNLQSTPEIYSGRARSPFSETDCSNIDQEFDNVPDFVNKRRGVNEYVLRNNKGWHIEDTL